MYPPEVEVLTLASWARATTVRAFLNRAYAKDVTVRAAKLELLGEMAALNDPAPFGVDARFPETGYYVNLSKGVWLESRTKLFGLLSSRSLGDRDMGAEATKSGPAGSFNEKFRGEQDRNLALQKALQSMEKALVDPTTLVNRASFEREFPWA